MTGGSDSHGAERIDWLARAGLADKMDVAAVSALSGLKPMLVKAKTVLFRPGTRPQGFVIVIDGQIGVYLVGRSGRELLLYSISHGETCIQTTLGLLGDEPYSAEAVAETDVIAVMVPLATFQTLISSSAGFRGFVFRSFAARVSDVMFVLEQVAFVRIESRLAHALRERADDGGLVTATHQELAVAIGSVREVVTRHLKAFALRGSVSLERGHIRILDAAALSRLAADDV